MLFESRIRLSLVATLTGWCFGIVYFLVLKRIQSLENDLRLIDAVATSGVMVLITWVVAFYPIIETVHPSSFIFKIYIFPIVAAVLGWIVFFIFFGFWTLAFVIPEFTVYPLIIGFSTGLFYSVFQSQVPIATAKDP